MRFAAYFVPLIYAGTDLALRSGVARRYTLREWGYFAASVLLSFLFHQALLGLLAWCRENSRQRFYRPSIAVAAMAYALVLVGTYTYYFQTGILPNAYTFEYVRQESFNSWTLLRDTFRWYHLPLILTIFGLFALAIYLATAKSKPLFPQRRGARALHLAAVAGLLLFFNNNVRFVDQCFVADVNTAAFSARQIYKSVKKDRFGSTGLLAHQGAPLPDSLGRPRFNVLWIVAESLRRQNLGVFGYGRPTTPRLAERVHSSPEKFFLMRNAFSNATRTLLSVPSLLTGASPAQPGNLLHRLPLIWEYAKPLGYATFFIASHSHDWYNYKVYFASPAVDHLWNREQSGLPAVNDLGVDDEKTVARFAVHTDSLARAGQRFCGVLHLNTNHYPYRSPEAFTRWRGERIDAYDNSILFQDHLLDAALTALERAGVLESTVVFFTSDHGEGFMEHGFSGHVESNYIEVLAVPLFLRLPGGALTSAGTAALRENENLPVSNLDLLPTLLDLWNIDSVSAVAPLRAQMLGSSLLLPVDRLRDIIACDNNEISRYKKGLSLVRGPWHYVLQVNTLPLRQELYRYDGDPWETKDLWGGLREDEKALFHRAFAPFPNCREVFTRWRVPFLAGPPGP